MNILTTHILDTANGCPAKGVDICLYKMAGPEHDADAELVKTVVTNDDGRTDSPLLSEAEFSLGYWKLVFKVGAYFKASNPSDTPFLSEVPLCFGMESEDHYHVPLLVSPWSYSTYRGS